MAVGVDCEMKKLVESLLAMVLLLMPWTKLAKHGTNANHARLKISNHVIPISPCNMTFNSTNPVSVLFAQE